MFEDSASFSQFLDSRKKVKLDRIIQKVVFKMDERFTSSSGITGKLILFESS